MGTRIMETVPFLSYSPNSATPCLPKLISGELPVPDAEAILRERNL